MAKSAEELIEAFSAALDLADRLIERGYGSDTPKEWHTAYKRVAIARAAIREDRAEMVSEAEVHAARAAWVKHDGLHEAFRAALEAARQARATAEEKGGAR